MSDDTVDKTNGEKTGQPTQSSGAAGEKKASGPFYPLPKIDFATFVLSINSSALVQLGLLEDPATGQKTRNILVAKQTIDLLAMLEEKTKGNLTQDEADMLKNILYELRMLYIKEKA